jgi:hypothetical protein
MKKYNITMKDLIDYIDWEELCQDANLVHGDLEPSQYQKLEELLQQFINQNK